MKTIVKRVEILVISERRTRTRGRSHMIIAPVSTITLLRCGVLFPFQFDTPLPEPVDTDPVTQPQDTAPTGMDPADTEPVKMEPGTDSFAHPSVSAGA